MLTEDKALSVIKLLYPKTVSKNFKHAVVSLTYCQASGKRNMDNYRKSEEHQLQIFEKNIIY